MQQPAKAQLVTSGAAEAADIVFEEVGAATANVDVHEAIMFGCRTLLAGDKIFACLYGGNLAVRLGRDSPEFALALSKPHSVVWDPTKRGRPFRDWVVVDAADTSDWVALALVAADRVRGHE